MRWLHENGHEIRVLDGAHDWGCSAAVVHKDNRGRERPFFGGNSSA